MAKNYNDNLSEEIKKGMLEKADQTNNTTCAPIGYQKVIENTPDVRATTACARSLRSTRPTPAPPTHNKSTRT
jgi:hypothetical protein